jgi:transcriptional regulator of acetoin/glycerol metabolism
MDRHAAATLAPGARPFPLAQGPAHVHAIQQSHERCRALGLTEDCVPELHPLSAYGARLMREPHQRLLEHATPVMDMLFEQIVSTKSAVALTDTDGSILQAVGDDSFLERLQQIALAPGVNWSEASKGTNAVGTALFTEAPTLVHGNEHFLAANRFLTCSASPIFDHAGQMIGVLDVSGHVSSYHPHTLAMVTMAARMIENQWFADKFRHGLRLHFHPQQRMLGTMREAMVALAPDGSLLGANRAALDHLGLNMAALRRQGLEAIFGTRVSSLADHCRHRADEPMPLIVQQGQLAGTPVYARALFNWPTLWPSVSLATGVAVPHEPAPCEAVRNVPPAVAVAAAAEPAAPTLAAPTLHAQEMAAIRQAVDAAGGNISRAARQLGVARNTIYRKLRAAAAEATG